MVRSGLVAWFCAVLVLGVSSLEDEWNNGESSSSGLKSSNVMNQTDTAYMSKSSQSTEDYIGKLSPGCIEKYHRTYVQRSVPKRTYRYFHEDQEYNKGMKDDQVFVPLQWRIIGGQQVDITQAPYAVLYGPYCGGSLISPDWVITAAHCKSRDNYIVSGSTKISEGVRYPICAHFIHPRWDDPEKLHFHDYDYQLLLLEKPVPVTPQSRPIAIGSLNDIRAGAMVSVSGWGHSETKQRHMLDIIRQVSVPIIPRDECKQIPHKYYTTITTRMFCAGFFNGTRDSCQGDSGGPAVTNNKLIGLVSFGVGCALKERPGVYAIVPLARPWIREVTGLPL